MIARGTAKAPAGRKDPRSLQDRLPLRTPAMTWAQRLKRVFNIDVESCVRCGAAVRVAAPAHPCARGISASLHVIASIKEPAPIGQMLAHVRG
jgi:hypothetical protein